jgi:hypothetical protein
MSTVGFDTAYHCGEVNDSVRTCLNKHSVNLSPITKIISRSANRFDLGTGLFKLAAYVATQEASSAGHNYGGPIHVH